MTESTDGVRCSTHGEGFATFVCEHLVRRPKQRWFSDYPSKREPRPDASCAACNHRYLRNGKWTKGIAKHIKILCHRCYDDARSRSSTYLGAEARGPWKRCLADARVALGERQRHLAHDFALGSHKRWDWNQSTGQLVFSNDGVPAVVARAHFLGSISTGSGTWLWAWANPSLERKMRDASKKVRAFGEKQGFARLTTARFEAGEADGWDMAAIGAQVLGADGIYRAPSDNGFLFMAMTKTRAVGKKAGARSARKPAPR